MPSDESEVLNDALVFNFCKRQFILNPHCPGPGHPERGIHYLKMKGRSASGAWDQSSIYNSLLIVQLSSQLTMTSASLKRKLCVAARGAKSQGKNEKLHCILPFVRRQWQDP